MLFRSDLLAVVATQGFKELTQAMRRASANESDALNRLKRAGLAYITFALRRPEHFAVMFDNPAPAQIERPDAADAAAESFDTLLNFVKSCQDSS